MIKQAEGSIYSISGTYFKSCDILSLKFLFLLNKNTRISVPAILAIIESKENLNDFRFISAVTGYLIFDDLAMINMINRTHSSNFQTVSETLFLTFNLIIAIFKMTTYRTIVIYLFFFLVG